MQFGKNKLKRRKAAWIAFSLVTLALLPVASAVEGVKEQDVQGTEVKHEQVSATYDAAAEASNAYSQALQTLSSLNTQATESPSKPDSSYSTASKFDSRGPIASFIRILSRLQGRTWMPSFLSPDKWISTGRKDDRKSRAIKVVDLLEHAVELGNTDALYKLAEVSLFPPSPLPLDAKRAFSSYQRHADITGNASSQAMLGFFYATGYGSVIPVDQAKALLYYTFAAHSDHQGAAQALGYRYWSGIAVNENCMIALDWYEIAAAKSMEKFLSGPPGGRSLPPPSVKLSDLDGGVYGQGASVASTGLSAHRAVIKSAKAKAAGETWEDVLEYYQYNADRGQIDYAFRLGKIYYQGSIYVVPGGIASGSEGVANFPRDFYRAYAYFLRIARLVWPRDSVTSPLAHKKEKKEGDDSTFVYAAYSAGYLGRMFLRGEGVKQDFKLAKMWFERGAEFNDRECLNGLGIIWREGYVEGGKRDIKKAIQYFMVAAGQDLAEAQVNLGKYHYSRREWPLATQFFEAAIRNGSPFEAYYYIADMQATQARRDAIAGAAASAGQSDVHRGGSCAIAVSFYKLISERGSWNDDIVRDGNARWIVGTEREKDNALLRWWIAAERGYETAQNNIAYVLDQDKTTLRTTRWAPLPSNETAQLALTQWTRSAAQQDIDALIKVGDYWYYGLGVANESEALRWEKAAGYYHSAADTQLSALAMWNLGWMYENGVGVPKDFHLAKRYYDMALETNSEAYLPVILSLIKLHARSLWHTLTGGSQKTLLLWSDQQDEDAWYLGKSKAEMRKRLRAAKRADRERGEIEGGAQENGPADDEDALEWARKRREEDEEGDFGPEDYFDGATRKREDLRDDDDVIETLVSFHPLLLHEDTN
ncbi:HCP-like protein [Sistotremastrum suecicum HHB10207 ss-3]|uniref:HCP-like protein n=1 Tax=Sistotremastrum suecicum HHB10207 ss-3 TaxID=1314776 RepID=A0A166E9M6_9AGAM|nr:HCP-like protein [Sistotremastrum suecicum HHB10207 ss-3]